MTMSTPVVFVGPIADDELGSAVLASGCRLTSVMDEADAVVWYGREPAELQGRLPARLRWLQLPDAGVEKWVRAGLVTQGFLVTSARGVYGPQVAEHALALMLACAHGVPVFARTTRWEPTSTVVRSLFGATVVIVGAGGIGSALIGLLQPLGAHVVAITRDGGPVQGAESCWPFEDFEGKLPEADVLVLAAPSTPETRHLIGERTLALMKPSAVLVNIARGDLIDTDALLRALDRDAISMVGLDVTEPEPLPEHHRLLTHPRALVTPHVANPPALKRTAFARRVLENCTRFAAGRPLVAVVDVAKGY